MLVEAREDSAKPREAPEQTLDVVAALVNLATALSGLDPGLQRRHDGDQFKVECLTALSHCFHRLGP